MDRRFRRGIELPVNAVIIIALAIFVLLMLAAFFSSSGRSINSAQVNTAFNEGCSQLSSVYSCSYGKMSEIKTNVIENGQAKSLLDVCRMSFNNPTMSAFKCMKACQVCPNMVTEGSYCEVGSGTDKNDDCQGPLTLGWACKEDKGELGCDGRLVETDECPTPENPGVTTC